MSRNSQPAGRAIAEAILNAAAQLNTEPTELHEKDDPYYWEPEYPDDKVDSLSTVTIISHNMHYAVASTYNFFASIGFQIIEFLGWAGSDYDWVKSQIDYEREIEDNERKEKEQEQQYSQIKARKTVERKTNHIEMGESIDMGNHK